MAEAVEKEEEGKLIYIYIIVSLLMVLHIISVELVISEKTICWRQEH